MALFVCPQCALGRELLPYQRTERIRCLDCEVTFRADGYVFDHVEWPLINDPQMLTNVATGKGCAPSPRKWRLLACGIGRVAYEWCRNPWFCDALRTAEIWADAGKPPRGVKQCRIQLERVEPPPLLTLLGREDDWYPSREEFAFQQQQERERFSWVQVALRCVSNVPQLQTEDITESTRLLATDLLRDLIPNPFVPLEWNPEWFTSTVRDLASHIYAKRAFELLPILGDALMDAGCDHQLIQEHCHSTKPHARGCWVVDAILVKT
jgi:hypothetical protein